MTSSTNALDGVRILAIEQMQALPYATQMLARLGAEVVKVEHPERGDLGRAAAPSVPDPWGRSNGSTFLRNNVTKRSVAIDLKAPAGHELLLELAPKFDVVAQNFRPAAATRLGIDFASVAAAHPTVVYCAVSGFGSGDSAYRDWPSFACIAEAMGGLYRFKGDPDVAPVVNPLGAIGDTGTAMFATIGILAGLRRRDLTGEAQEIDIAMYDSMVALADAGINYTSMGIPDAGNAPLLNHAFRADDGFFVMMCNNRAQFEGLARLVGKDEWLDDDRLADGDGWVAHAEDVIRPGIEAWAAAISRVEACDALAGAGVAAGPVHTATEVIDDPFTNARQMITPVPGAELNGSPVLTTGNPVKVGDGAGVPDRRPPWLGEDTAAVLRQELGMDQAELDRLVGDGVIGAPLA